MIGSDAHKGEEGQAPAEAGLRVRICTRLEGKLVGLAGAFCTPGKWCISPYLLSSEMLSSAVRSSLREDAPPSVLLTRDPKRGAAGGF